LPAPIVNGGEDKSWKSAIFRTSEAPGTLTMDRVIPLRHTIVHHSLTSIYIPNFIEIGKTFSGRTYILRDIFPSVMLLRRLGEVDLKSFNSERSRLAVGQKPL